MVQNPLQNIQHQFQHLPTGIEEFLTALFNEEMPKEFNRFFDIKSYGYVYHPGGYYFHTLILQLNPEELHGLPDFQIGNLLKEIPTEIDEGVHLFWYYNDGTLHIMITGSR